jgi:hypothetical protein
MRAGSKYIRNLMEIIAAGSNTRFILARNGLRAFNETFADTYQEI